MKGYAPPWAMPGDPMARIYLTANAGYWLARGDDRGEAARRAAMMLEAHADSTGSLSSFPHAHWMAAGCLYATNHEVVAELIMSHIVGTMIETLPASNLAWLLVTLLPVGVPRAAPIIASALEYLREAQQPDGRWISEDGPQRDVHATLEALRGLKLAGSSVPAVD